MKKFLSILLALAMVLSLSVSAFATEQDATTDPTTTTTPTTTPTAPTSGTITITNATVNEVYTIYKIFDASINTNATGETDGVSYSIVPGTPLFNAIFAEGSEGHNYFIYYPDTNAVTKKQGANDTNLIAFLQGLIATNNYQPAKDPITASSSTVTFTELPFGYYLITSGLGAAVTINSNTPDVSVIDKNQTPGGDFDKQIRTGGTDANPTWGDSNSANIGDRVTYRISFEATNYDGDKKIKYYQIYDEKGNAIWADFNSFKVYVNGEPQLKGYYLAQGGINTDGWQWLGNWGETPVDQRNMNDADWYLVHTDEDTFRITIPWLENHSIGGSEGAYTLNFEENAPSKFTSPVNVEIIYDAVIEANASIGVTSHGNRFNKAYASWTSEHETGATTPEEVVTYVYGIGLLKDDIATGVNLAGAKFRIYRDQACTDEVYVIPTDVDGIYVVDSLGTPLDTVSGTGKDTTRELFADRLDAYLKDEEGNPINQNNLVVSQVNGKLAILGLKEGTYYLKEVQAPSGYNAIDDVITLEVGSASVRPFIIFAKAEDGTVADIQTEDGVHIAHRLDLTHTVVHNSKGLVLPSTGGEGTFWLITIGTMVAICFAVFLITNKKMSVYTD